MAIFITLSAIFVALAGPAAILWRIERVTPYKPLFHNRLIMKQIILIAGLLLFATLGLFPPWVEEVNFPGELHVQRPLGYSFIGSPPSDSTLIKK